MMEIRLKSTYLELLFLCLCLLTVLGPANGQTVVRVTEGSEAVLNCFIRPERDITPDVFEWKKDGQKVFFYENGKHHNNGLTGQDEQFKGRVSDFPDQLQVGDASIVINNTKLSDSGNYICDYSPDQPNRQTYNIKLDVCDSLKDRSEKNIPGVSPKPVIMSLHQTRGKVQLQCEVQGVSPKPKVKWQDSSGNILHAEEPQITERGGSYNIILNMTVNKTDDYYCVVTQEEICHQVSAVALVYIYGTAVEVDVTTIKREKEVLLQCFVQGPSPPPEVEWQDSDGEKLPAKEPDVKKREDGHDIILQAVVTKTDNFRCVVTQKEIKHKTTAEIYAQYDGPETGWIVGGVFIALIVLGVIQAVLVAKGCIKLSCKKGSQTETKGDEEKSSSELDKLNKSPSSSDNKISVATQTETERDEEEKL